MTALGKAFGEPFAGKKAYRAAVCHPELGAGRQGFSHLHRVGSPLITGQNEVKLVAVDKRQHFTVPVFRCGRLIVVKEGLLDVLAFQSRAVSQVANNIDIKPCFTQGPDNGQETAGIFAQHKHRQARLTFNWRHNFPCKSGTFPYVVIFKPNLTPQGF